MAAEPWIFASANPHKLAEVQAICPVRPLPLGLPSAPETHDSLHANALAKAAFYVSFVQQPVVAEDSGLFVPALGGKPGVHSARYGGPVPLLIAMQGISHRQAYFAAVVVAYRSPAEYTFFTGYLAGTIATEMRGSQGFGYDPIFIPQGETQTLAELGADWKNLHSHRAQAFKAFRLWLEKHLT
ncbi:MAG: RdgB/HAM1 family non-canonical purine NTP pyrophosphatase [Bacteroidia bacterium]|nr:RdgB/HAM1 family non-canonical purine NTP pyrophosphatase [Bacteroidia bacterium]MDW8235240.1 RdgB/HAM1 family non-canonical purine NTP pyrophosphatase [Bacteroidia bacterium]